MTDQTIIEKAAAAARDVHGLTCGETWVPWAKASPKKRAEWLAMTRAAIQSVADNTPSLRTAEELNRILGEA